MKTQRSIYKARTKFLIALTAILFTSTSCKKESLEEEEETPPTSAVTPTENICEPYQYISCILHSWDVDSSNYYTENNPNYNGEVIHSASSEATYDFEYDIQNNDRTVFYDSGNIANGTSFGPHSFPTTNDPTHLRMEIYGVERNVYIRHLSDERLIWTQFDITGNGYTDSLQVYLSRD